MKTIRDAVQGNIHLNDVESAVLMTPEMQRMHNIKQTGFAYLVYPGAKHSRFDHSLGSMYVAGRAGEALELKEDELQQVKLAAFLHDVGHGPFSHASESAAIRYGEAPHEERTYKRIISSGITKALEDHNQKPKDIARIATGDKPPLSQIVSSDLDVDRMDYLIRDAYHTGVAYGVIDLDRLVQVLQIHKNKLVVSEMGLSTAESLVLARYLMYPTVYAHHALRIANTMFGFAILQCLENSIFTASELHAMDDIDLIARLRALGTKAGEMMQRIERRELYKTAVRMDKDELGPSFNKLIKMRDDFVKLEKLEHELTTACKLESGEVLLDIGQPVHSKETQLNIFQKGVLQTLEEASPLVNALRKAQWSYWNVSVYTDEANLELVEKKVKGILLGL